MIFWKSALLCFSSKCVMSGRVNIVGHGQTLYHSTNEEPLSAGFTTIILSAAKALKAFHFSERLLCMGSFISSEKIYFSSWLRNFWKLAWPFSGFHIGLGLKAGVSLKFSDSLLRKCHIHRILQENSSKSFLSSG